ncbi:hypothetical protein [Nonomuraea endophytica]|uniref:Uncharacterized protein n=1 Tax=Nonomuraea endophytica TaxID=714136 RepID=A0A7W8ACF5_9ACTN|nr:hypothetical protein [Nonomuraea endophytica]MBB5082640.1 hypothetical protein [Nonomuraea endophytica]
MRTLPLGGLVVGAFVTAVLSCAVAAPLFPEAVARTVVVAVLAGAYSLWGRSLLVALAAAGMAWLFVTGFLVNGLGVLTFAEGDLIRLGVLAAAAIGGYVIGAAPGVRRLVVHSWRGRPASSPREATPSLGKAL